MATGWKTILTGAAMILYGLGGMVLGKLDGAHAGEIVMEGFGLIFLRLGIAKAQDSAKEAANVNRR